MTQLGELYRQHLQLGFIVLRQAADAGDWEWVNVELELLHNVPSLIGETNPLRHEYFLNKERTTYLEWVSVPGREFQKSRMATYYEPLWSEMEEQIKALR